MSIVTEGKGKYGKAIFEAAQRKLDGLGRLERQGPDIHIRAIVVLTQEREDIILHLVGRERRPDAQHVTGPEEAVDVLRQLEDVQLLVLVYPVAPKALKAAGS